MRPVQRTLFTENAMTAMTATIAAAAAVPVPAMVEDDTVWSDDSVGWVRWVGA